MRQEIISMCLGYLMPEGKGTIKYPVPNEQVTGPKSERLEHQNHVSGGTETKHTEIIKLSLS